MIWALLAVALFGTLRFFSTGEIAARVPAPYHLLVVHIFGVALTVALCLLADRLIRRLLWDGYLRRKRKRETPALIEDIVTIALIVLGISIGLSFEAGVSLTGIVTASGATAIVLGIALQAIIQDLFSGLSINFDGSYAIGDWLTIYSDQISDPVYGCVTGITWRTTYLRLDDGRRLIIPNRVVTTNPVMNHSRPPGPKRLSVEIHTDVRFPSDRAMSILLGEAYRVVHQHELAPFPEPDVILTKLGNDEAVYEVRFYAEPNVITPPRARSLVANRLQMAMLAHRLPTAVSQIELTPAPGSFAFGEADVRGALGNVTLFSNVLDDNQLASLARQCRAALIPDDALFIRQGEQTASMFVLLEGAARVTVVASDGGVHDVAVLAAGDIVGEMSLMTGAPRTATVTALTNLRVLEITKEPIEALLQAAPQLLERFSSVLAQRQLELTSLTAQTKKKAEAEADLLDRMRRFFSRAFGVEDSVA